MNKKLYFLSLLCLLFLISCHKTDKLSHETTSVQKQSPRSAQEQPLQLNLPGTVISMEEVSVQFGLFTENKQLTTTYTIPKELYGELKSLLEENIAYPQGEEHSLADMPEDYMDISFSPTTSLLIRDESFAQTSGKDIYGNPIPHEEMMYINYLSKEHHEVSVYHSRKNLMEIMRQFLQKHSLQGENRERER